jgi:aldose 1-epimerase
VLSALALFAAPAGAGGPSVAAGRPGPFSATSEEQPGVAWKAVILRYEDPRRPELSLEAKIAPEVGGNLYSLRLGQDELLVQPEKLADLGQMRAGTPILFPTPNRVRDAKLSFEGRELTFEANNGKNFIHGLVRKRPWRADAPRVTGAGVAVDVSIDWDDQQPDFARFPIKHRLTVTYTLGRGGLRIAYVVENRDAGRLPFGFALHPWFPVPGKREDVLLTIPAAVRMEAVDKLPTGKLLPVDGNYDLRKPTPLTKLDLDDVYLGLAPTKAPAFEWRDRKIRVTLGGSKEFTHVVVFTPPDRPVFCVENQTSSTDAHNLWDKGLRRESHLQIVAPGKRATGWVDWKVARLGAGSLRSARPD